MGMRLKQGIIALFGEPLREHIVNAFCPCGVGIVVDGKAERFARSVGDVQFAFLMARVISSIHIQNLSTLM